MQNRTQPDLRDPAGFFMRFSPFPLVRKWA
jgi:hypothetical protein